MRIGIVQVTQIMDCHDTAPRMKQRQDMRGHEQHIGLAYRSLQTQTDVRPQAPERNGANFDMGGCRAGPKQAGRQCAIRVESKPMLMTQPHQLADEVHRVCLGPSPVLGRSAAGINPDQHVPIITRTEFVRR